MCQASGEGLGTGEVYDLVQEIFTSLGAAVVEPILRTEALWVC